MLRRVILLHSVNFYNIHCLKFGNSQKVGGKGKTLKTHLKSHCPKATIVSVFLYFLSALGERFFRKILLQGQRGLAQSPANTSEGDGRKSLNRNPTGLGMERKEGLGPGCLPPALKDKLSELSGGRQVKWETGCSKGTKASVQDTGCGRARVVASWGGPRSRRGRRCGTGPAHPRPATAGQLAGSMGSGKDGLKTNGR